jgi:uncharacterized protein YggT (Ycf19 family)
MFNFQTHLQGNVRCALFHMNLPDGILVQPIAASGDRRTFGGSPHMTYRSETDYVAPDGYPQGTEIRRVSYSSSPGAVLERLIVFIFGLIELLIVVRIVLLLVAARESNAIVQFIYNVSDIFVAPFRGILGMNEIQAGAAAFDVAALVALVGWVIIEFIILALVRVFRPAATT